MEQINITSASPEAEEIRENLKNHPSIFDLTVKIRDGFEETFLQKNPEGRLIGSDGEMYLDSPRIRELIKIAKLIKANLPPVSDDHIRLWRGNRNGEVGLNPSYTNSLEGIALSFLMSYNGPLSYIDIPKQDLKKYLCLSAAASGSEFILPKDIVVNVHIFGMSDEEAVKLKSQSKPEEPMSNGWNSLTV